MFFTSLMFHDLTFTLKKYTKVCSIYLYLKHILLYHNIILNSVRIAYIVKKFRMNHLKTIPYAVMRIYTIINQTLKQILVRYFLRR